MTTKLDWEKQNRAELVVKRLNQFLNEQGVGSSEHDELLRALHFIPSIEALEAVRLTHAEHKIEWRRLRQVLERSKRDGNPETDKRKDFLRGELNQIYVNLLVIRLIAIDPEWMTRAESL